METVIVSIICLGLIVFGGMTMSQGFMTSVDASTAGFQSIGKIDETLVKTRLSPFSCNMTSPNTLELILENNGQIKLADFDKWDVIVQYYENASSYYTMWLPYASGAPGNNQWTVTWIRLNGQAEVYEPNILNPGEQIMIRAQLNPDVGSGFTNMIVVATPNGVTASTFFSR